MGFREIKSTPIFDDKPEVQQSTIPKVIIPKSAFTMPIKPRPAPVKPLPAPAPESTPVPKPTLIQQREPIHIQEMMMDPKPTPALDPQPQPVPPRPFIPQQQFVPFTPPTQPTHPTQRQITLPSITIPELNTSNAKRYGIAMVKGAVAIVLIWFGLTSTGSYFGPASGKFSGQLAQVFYQYQLGTLVACCGIVLAYDAISRLR
jgi:hypothetical protein